MRKKDLLICTREDSYCIEDLKMISHPKLNEIVEVVKVTKDEDGTWLELLGYNEYIYDSSCFRQLSLNDINSILNKEIVSV